MIYVYMRLFTLIMLTCLITACTSVAPTPSPEEPVAARCRTLTSEEEERAVAAPEMVLAAVDRSRRDDQRCGPPPDHDRICRALFVMSTLDPALVLDDDQHLERVAEAVAWAAEDGAASTTDTEVRQAFELLGRTALDLVDETDDSRRADLIIGRVSAIEPLEAAWATCE
jgi:hypothetical protein